MSAAPHRLRARCSHVADTQVAASLRKMVTRHDQEGTTEMNTRRNPDDVAQLIKTGAKAVLATS